MSRYLSSSSVHDSVAVVEIKLYTHVFKLRINRVGSPVGTPARHQLTVRLSCLRMHRLAHEEFSFQAPGGAASQLYEFLRDQSDLVGRQILRKQPVGSTLVVNPDQLALLEGMLILEKTVIIDQGDRLNIYFVARRSSHELTTSDIVLR